MTMDDFEQIKASIAALYDDCLNIQAPFHRKLDLFLVPEHVV
jgi:hypothetical protein